jgi:hypothetical protein
LQVRKSPKESLVFNNNDSKSISVRIVLVLVLIFGVFGVIPVRADTLVHNLSKVAGEENNDTARTANVAVSGSLIIPTRNDWQAGSLAFSRGSEGEWDHILWGGFANSLIKKGDTYYLYYQGSPSYDNQCESVSQRAIGVATSTDGISWVKSARNPVITWSSQGSIEEGAVSSAAWVGEDGKIYIYYGANTGTGCNVNASVRLAVSEDGENFQDLGEVLSGSDPVFGVRGMKYSRWVSTPTKISGMSTTFPMA